MGTLNGVLKYDVDAMTEVDIGQDSEDMVFHCTEFEGKITDLADKITKLQTAISHYQELYNTFKRDYYSDSLDEEIGKSIKVFFGSNGPESDDSIVSKFQHTFAKMQETFNWFVDHDKSTAQLSEQERTDIKNRINNLK